MKWICCICGSKGTEARMYNLNLIYHPDHQQVLEHHKELLKEAEQARLVRSIIPTSKHPLASLQKLLQLMISIRHTHKMVPTTARNPSAQH
jgi:hypothetical protein